MNVVSLSCHFAVLTVRTYVRDCGLVILNFALLETLYGAYYATVSRNLNPNLAIRVRVRVGLRLGLGKSLFPVSRVKDQRLPAGLICCYQNNV